MKKILKLSILVFLSFVFVFPMMVGAAINPQTGLEEQTLAEFQQQQQNSPAGQAAAASAQATACDNLVGLGKIICQIHKILNSIVPVLLALGVLYFVWGVVSYVIGDEGEAKKKGRDRIIYGIIGLACIVGLWGLVNIVVSTFDLGGIDAPSLTSLTLGGSNSACNLPTNPPPKLQNLLNYATCIINNSVIPLIFALAVVMFIWGVVQFVINSAEEAKKEKGRQFMIWGIIALAVMVSVWGLVSILGNTFGIDAGFIPQVKSP